MPRHVPIIVGCFVEEDGFGNRRNPGLWRAGYYLAWRNEGDHEPSIGRAKESRSQRDHEAGRNGFDKEFVEHREVDGGKRYVVQIERDGIRREDADKINTISLSGGNQIIEQLKDTFVPRK